MTDGAPRYLAGSVFFKLLAVMATMTLAILFLVGSFFGWVVRPAVGASVQSIVQEYARLLAASRPDLATARKIAERTDIGIRYEGPDGAWTTAPHLPTIEQAQAAGLSISGGIGPEHYLVSRADGGRYLLVWALGRRVEAAHDRLLLTFLGLLVVLVVVAHEILRRGLRPLRALHEGVARLGRGDLATRVPRLSNDEFGTLTDAFNQMVGRVREQVQAREQLLLDVSHELRSPLTRMKVSLALAPEGDMQRRLAAEVARMEEMVTGLLELERVRDGRSLRFGLHDLGALVREAAQLVGERPPGLHLGPLPERLELRLDPAEVKTALRNVLDNALQYSPPESRPIELLVSHEGTAVVVEVRDSGPGIPEPDLPSLFDPFFRVDRSRSKRTGGYGLGLSLCRRIMEAHGGSITAANRPGGGASFRLSFPKDGARQ